MVARRARLSVRYRISTLFAMLTAVAIVIGWTFLPTVRAHEFAMRGLSYDQLPETKFVVGVRRFVNNDSYAHCKYRIIPLTWRDCLAGRRYVDMYLYIRRDHRGNAIAKTFRFEVAPLHIRTSDNSTE